MATEALNSARLRRYLWLAASPADMIVAQKPNNEGVRLKRLRALGLLDTEAEERFDVVTRLAQRLFNVPIALVSLVDDNRQWFKSCVGLGAKETSRDVSFCAHAILQDEVFVVPNALKDERFHDNPLVTDDPNIRFYAGYPLDSEGLKVGTLCIIDREPREFSDAEAQMLVDLGGLAERELAAMELAALDEGTGLVNRRGLYVTGRNLLNVARQTGRPVSVLFFDLDGFKYINDTYGHAEGDRALAEFSDCLVRAFASSEVIARLGGDEFSVLLTSEYPESLRGPLDRLARIVADINADRPEDAPIRYSVGMASYDPSRHGDFQDLLRDADEAMYVDKGDRQRSAA